MTNGTAKDTWHGDGKANETGEFAPPTMHVGTDGARMETHRAIVNGHVAAQITFAVDSVTGSERKAIIELMRQISVTGSERKAIIELMRRISVTGSERKAIIELMRRISN